jgi:hypothetical protein
MIGNANFDGLIGSAPTTSKPAKVDWEGVREAFASNGIDASAVVAVAWCGHRSTNMDAGVDFPTLAVVHPGGILCTTGKRKMMGKGVKFDSIPFGRVQQHAAIDVPPGTNVGRFAITFLGPGQIVLGSLTWEYPVKRFKNTSEAAMDAASDRDRIYKVVESMLSA